MSGVRTLAGESAVQLESTDLVHLDRHSFMWVLVKRFAIDRVADDDTLLQGLFGHPGYRGALVDYETRADDDLDVHGPYLATDIVPGLFTATDAASARSALRAWADGDAAHDPEDHHAQSTQTHDRLEARVLSLFDRGRVLRLDVGQLKMLDWAYAGKIMGFCEFVVIDRVSGHLHLIVAADD